MSIFNSVRHIFILEGILLIILGLIAVAFPGFTTLGFELFLGWLFLISGVIQAYRAFKLRHAPGLLGSSLNAALSIILGILLLAYPISGIISLAVLLMVYFILEGIFKIIWGFQYRKRNFIQPWGWLIFSGIVSLVMAFLIWYGWPGTAFWVIGLLFGINLIFFGASLLGVGFALPKTHS